MKAASLDRRFQTTDNSAARNTGLQIPLRRTAVFVGTLFLVQMVTAMAGSAMIDTFVTGNSAAGPATGVLLMVASGLAVTGIGFLMYPLLRLVNGKLAVWYPRLRLAELSVSVAGGIYLLATLNEIPNQMLLLYLPTGMGGLVLNYLLLTGKLVPRPIAVLGLVGYALLLGGAVADLANFVDMNNGPGLALLAPGGLFEFVVLPIWLFTKGFRLPALKK